MIGFEQGDCVGDEDDQRGDDPHVHLKQGTVGVVGGTGIRREYTASELLAKHVP